jgi:putative oxidoreductase
MDLTADSTSFDAAVLLLRLVFGVIFALHGVNKFRSGIDATSRWFESIGMRQPRFQARAAASGEIAAGLLLAIGLLTPFAAAAIVGIMIVATWAAHRSNGLFIFNDGWEYTVSIITVVLAIAIFGPGRFSLDELLSSSIGWSIPPWGRGAIAVGLGAFAGVSQLLVFYRPTAKQP